MYFFREYLGFDSAELEGATVYLITTILVILAARLLASPYGGKRMRELCRYAIGYWAIAMGIAAIFASFAVVAGDCEHHDSEADETGAVDPHMICGGPSSRTAGGHIRHFIQLSGYAVAFVPFSIGAVIYAGYRVIAYEPEPGSS